MTTHHGSWTHNWLATAVRRDRFADAGHASTSDPPPPLARTERVLATGSAAGDPAGVVCSTRALYHHPADTADTWNRVGWEEIDRVDWNPDGSDLTLTALPGSERAPLTLHLDEAGRLGPVIRDRVAASVIVRTVVSVNPGRALITVRRRPETDDLVWVVHLGRGIDPTASGLNDRVDTAIRALRADLGL
ncbi:hypothetical protein [Actinokineospora sp.]|uniref:hypothetical protein n=1 Tax=Actinokineospora sp. TaxID=1872133 RepID=UPI003D6A9EE0